MVPPFPSKHVPAVDEDFLTFINEFLFNPPPQDSSARSTLRHQRSFARHKRYRTMWRAAASSLIKKKYSSQETHSPFPGRLLARERPCKVLIDNGHPCQATGSPAAQQPHRKLPNQVSVSNGYLSPASLVSSAKEPLREEVSLDEGHPSQTTHSSSVYQYLRKPPSQVFLDDRSSQVTDLPSADRLVGNFPSEGSLHHGTISSQQHSHSGIDVDAVEEASLITPACSKSKLKGSASGLCSKTQRLEATSTSAIPKHSSRKPPRPPRASVTRSGSYRAIRLKTAARRAMVDNARMRKQKSLKSTSNVTPIWAFFITLCFVAIMLIQGFLGNSSKDFDSKAEGQLVGEGVSSVSPYLQISPFASAESSTHVLVAEHGAGRGLDKTQHKESRKPPFMNLRRHRL